MKAVTRLKSAKGERMEERFQKFAKALMAVPKKELEKNSSSMEGKRKRKLDYATGKLNRKFAI